MGRDLNDVFAEARAAEAGQMYARKHYRSVLLSLRMRWLPYVAIGAFLAYCYITGRNG